MKAIKSLFTKKSKKTPQPAPPVLQISNRNRSSFYNSDFASEQQEKKEIKNLSKTDSIPRIIIVLDETGSMQSSKPVTISSYNEWLDSNRSKDENEEYFPRFTLVRFNTVSELEEHDSVETAPKLTNQNYNPSNCTALYDAIGKSINSYKDEKNNIMVIFRDAVVW